MEFMREGGLGMWLMLATAVGVVAWVATRRQGRAAILFGGAFALLLQGVLGMTLGMEAVAAGIASRGSGWSEAGYTVGLGLGELANDGTFAVVLATGLACAALVLRRVEATATS